MIGMENRMNVFKFLKLVGSLVLIIFVVMGCSIILINIVDDEV